MKIWPCKKTNFNEKNSMWDNLKEINHSRIVVFFLCLHLLKISCLIKPSLTELIAVYIENIQIANVIHVRHLQMKIKNEDKQNLSKNKEKKIKIKRI